MKRPKIFSLVLASVISASAVASLSANAWQFSGKEDLIENVDEYFSDSEKYLDVADYKCLWNDIKLLWNDNDAIACYKVLNAYELYRFNDYPDYITLDFSSDAKDLVADIIKGVDDSLQIDDRGVKSMKITRVDAKGNYMEIPTEMVREIYGLVEEHVKSFDYHYDIYNFIVCGTGYLTSYSADNISVLKECVERNNIDAEIVQFESKEEMKARINFSGDISKVYVVPNEELSYKERLDLAELIYEDTGLSVECFILEGAGKTVGNEVELCNAVDGDANCDNELSIADSTLILQHIGNADKYKLSAQGEFNADVSGEYDGISAADAVTIQKFKVGAIDKLG